MVRTVRSQENVESVRTIIALNWHEGTVYRILADDLEKKVSWKGRVIYMRTT